MGKPLEDLEILNAEHDNVATPVKKSGLYVWNADTNDWERFSKFAPNDYDAVYQTYPDTVTDVFTFKKDGTTVGVITITYQDDTKANMVSAIRS